MSTRTSNPIAINGENQFAPEAQYGQVEQQAELLREAPISGAPTVPAAPTAAPRSGSSRGREASPTPPISNAEVGAAYYSMLAETWRQLASLPGASPVVKAYAKRAQQMARPV